MNLFKRLFPKYQLGKADYIIGGILLLFCFFAFYEPDLNTTGWNSLNFLYGNALEFYENCKKIQGKGVYLFANYPPSFFAAFALWFYPFKLFGLIKSPFNFPGYLVYWMKVLTSLVYAATGLVFYRVTQLYNHNKKWGVYATWLWLTSPIAVCSQFIYAQYDIFYVFLAVLGFFFFLKRRIYLASFIFGLSITFKYFPIVIFLPLLLFFEKRFLRLILAIFLFAIPMLIMQKMYGHSPAYILGVLRFGVIYFLFNTYVDFLAYDVKVYYIFLIFSLFCCYCYYLDFTDNYKKIASYILLFGSIFPFLFFFWHPNWLILSTPAIILTTVLDKQDKVARLLFIDLFAMYCFVAYNVTLKAYQNIFDLALFHADLFHIPFKFSFNMANFFEKFLGGFTTFSWNIYFSLFIGYLVLQLILKYKSMGKIYIKKSKEYPYRDVRINYYVGISIFLIPAIVSFITNNRANLAGLF